MITEPGRHHDNLKKGADRQSTLTDSFSVCGPRTTWYGSVMELTIREVLPQDARSIIDILNPIIAARTFTVFDQLLTEQEERDYILNFPKAGVLWLPKINRTGPWSGFRAWSLSTRSSLRECYEGSRKWPSSRLNRTMQTWANSSPKSRTKPKREDCRKLSAAIIQAVSKVSDEAKKGSDRAGSVSERTFPRLPKPGCAGMQVRGKSLSLTLPALKEGRMCNG